MTIRRAILILSVAVFMTHDVSAQVVRRTFSWSLGQGNDPILHVTSIGSKTLAIQVRLVFEENIYRYPQDLEVPPGENRFIRIREVRDYTARRYPELAGLESGTLQIEYAGEESDVQTRMVNLNPKTGITADRESDAGGIPRIDAVEPRSGRPDGGTVVRITGKNFRDSTVVKFAGIPAMRNRISDDAIIAVTPPHDSGAVDVEVQTRDHSNRLRRGFTYEWESPRIVRVDPETGPLRGGIRARLIGQHFQDGARIVWDGKVVESRWESPESLSITVPSGRPGTIDMEITNPDGKGSTLTDAFTYRGTPNISNITPATGISAGGYTVTVTGSDFESGSSVIFGSLYGQTTFLHPQALAAVVPPAASGYVDVSVTTPDGQVSTLPGAFLYNDPPQVLSINAYPNPIVRNTTTTITVEAMDPEGGYLNYDYRVMQGPPGASVSGNGKTAIFHSPNTIGTAVVQVTVSDQHQAIAQQNIQITVE